MHGLPPTPQGLQAWDPERYGTLSITSDDDSFDIFTQAARAVGPDRRPHHRSARRSRRAHGVIAMGARSRPAGWPPTSTPSTRSVRVVRRLPPAHLLRRRHARWRSATRWSNIVDPTEPFDVRTVAGSNRLRDDLDVPVMVVNSELEAIACHPVRQPDTDPFRYWEAAGTCHVSAQSMRPATPEYERDFGRLPADARQAG